MLPTEVISVAVKAHGMGYMECECWHCCTLFFADESIKHDGMSTMCCMRRKVHLPPLGEYLQLVHHLLKGDSNDFTDCRIYNVALSFASFSVYGIVASSRCSVNRFQIRGQVHRLTSGAARHPAGKEPQYNQLYFIDVDAVNAAHPGLGNDPNGYNLPAAINKVAAIFVGDVPPMRNYIRIYPKDRPEQFMSPQNVLADPMTYPLLFPHGTCINAAKIPKLSCALQQTRSLHHVHLQPKWPEIVMSLEGCQQACHRPDVVCRSFKVKFNSRIDDIYKKQIFGKVDEYTNTIEIHKRGLPHAHIIIILDKGDKMAMSEAVDETVLVDIPD
ncbi:hypothetical protein PR048_010325 [Dryococelus australis]|uniref:Helitron helicase-like domain-containing protein n=1 Tax=Dryococelus australis TaxID=614101 RepID=A0ABQ9I2F4_9NEOP|nr:hypothetical protein PR048_010325 [Dryococelus australis]